MPTPLPFQFSKLVILSIHLNSFYPRLLNFFVAKFNFSLLILTDSPLLPMLFSNVSPIHLYLKSFSGSPLLLELILKSPASMVRPRSLQIHSIDLLLLQWAMRVSMVQRFCTFSFTHFYICLSLSVNTTKTWDNKFLLLTHSVYDNLLQQL